MTNKSVSKAWMFQSSTKTGLRYQTIQYSDGSTSCDCPGWTRRVARDGSRSCKHTRMVAMGEAESECIKSMRFSYASSAFTVLPGKGERVVPAAQPAGARRQFNLDE